MKGAMLMDNNQQKTIGKDYPLGGLAKFCSTAVFTQMMFSLLMSLDDSLFISRYLGPTALAAFSVTMPVFMIHGAISSILGGCASLCSSKMGEGKTEEAAGDFSSIAIFCIFFGTVTGAVMRVFMDPILRFCGATELLLPLCRQFFSIMVWSFPLSMVSRLFTFFYVPAGKPSYNMITTLMSAVFNIVFDWLFIVRFGFGMRGPALANLCGTVAVLVFGFIFYSGKNCEIGFGKPSGRFLPLLAMTIKLGFPHMVTSVALGINGLVINKVLIAEAGEMALSANSIVNSMQFIFMSAFFGVSSSISPMLSFAYGERKPERIRRIIRQYAALVLCLAAIVVTLYLLGKGYLVRLYLREDSDPTLKAMVLKGLSAAAPTFPFFGLVIVIQDLFTGVQNTRVSALISLAENAVFSNLTVIFMTKWFGLDGFWWTFATQEFLAFLLCLFLYLKYRNVYGYGSSGTATHFSQGQIS
jgi:putative MATE family efflux protein